MNHLELFLLDHENEIRAKILSNVVNHLESKSKQLQLSGKTRKGLQRKDASLERKRPCYQCHYIREHKSNTQTQIIKPCALCSKMLSLSSEHRIEEARKTSNPRIENQIKSSVHYARRRHVVSHMSGYWECEYCITKCKRKADLAKHLRIVHSDFISEPSLSITKNEYNDVLEKKFIECYPTQINRCMVTCCSCNKVDQ